MNNIQTPSRRADRSVLMIPGGPGFSSNYLVDPISSLSFDFAPLSRPASKLATFTQTVAHLAGCLSRRVDEQGSVRVIAHSWGCLILAAAICRLTNDSSRADRLSGVLINPIPLDNLGLAFVSRELRARMSTRRKIAILWHGLVRGDGEAVLKELLPCYGVETDNASKLYFDIALYKSVMSSAGAFDFSQAPPRMSSFRLLLGEHDITPKPLLAGLIQHCAGLDVLPSRGHFPMFEAPREYSHHLLSALVATP